MHKIKQLNKMDFKIFQVKGKPPVLVYRDTDDDGKHKVRLKTFFPDKDDSSNEYFHEEIITFENGGKEVSQRFIKDLSLEGVEEFLNRFNY